MAASAMGGRRSGPRSNLAAASFSFAQRMYAAKSPIEGEVIRTFETAPGFNLPVGETMVFSPRHFQVGSNHQLYFHIWIDEEATLGIEWNADFSTHGDEGWILGESHVFSGITSEVGHIAQSNVLANLCRFDVTAGATNPVTNIRVIVYAK